MKSDASTSGEVTRAVHIDRQYVLFPINNEAAPRRVRLATGDSVVRSFSASLGLPAHWWAHLDVSDWQDQELLVSIAPDLAFFTWEAAPIGRQNEETPNSELLAEIQTSATVWSPETIYSEPLRPIFHFSAQRGWTNDPNGLFYHAGKYHLFFQHNPFGVQWGNTHWGHAVSSDLVHWKELPIAISPKGEDDFPYSGSAVVDVHNGSGLGSEGRVPLIIAFTSSGRGECLTFSLDDGRSWTEFEGNPVLTHNGRDPKLLWHGQTGKWVIGVYSERPSPTPGEQDQRGIAFYTSPDLSSWKEEGWVDDFYECPDLYELPVDGDPEHRKWVLSCAAGYYLIGDFDGSQFTSDLPRLPSASGGTQLANAGFPPSLLWAAQTFDNHPEGDRVEIAWILAYIKDAPFSQMMSFPTKLSLRTTAAGIRLCREPIKAIEALRSETYEFSPSRLTSTPILTDLKGEAWDLEILVKVGTISPVLLEIAGDEYHYKPGPQILSGPGGMISIPLVDERLRMRVLVDRTTVEIIGGQGEAYGVFIRSDPGGNALLGLRTWDSLPEESRVEELRVHRLRSAWAN